MGSEMCIRDSTFCVQKHTGEPKVLQEAPPPISPHPFGYHFGVSFQLFSFLNAASREPPKRPRNKCLFGPSQTSKNKTPPRRKLDLQVSIKVRRKLEFVLFFFRSHFGALGVILVKKGVSKNASKKEHRQSQMAPYSPAMRLPDRQPLFV